MVKVKVITTVNGFQIETYEKELVTKLADYIDSSREFNVTEIVFSWATDQCVIRVYPTDQAITTDQLINLINKYYGLPE